MCVVHLLQISYYNPTKHIPHEGTIIICLNVAVQLRIINSCFRKILSSDKYVYLLPHYSTCIKCNLLQVLYFSLNYHVENRSEIHSEIYNYMYRFKYSGTQLIGSPMGYENLAVIRGDHNYLGGKSMAGFHCIS